LEVADVDLLEFVEEVIGLICTHVVTDNGDCKILARTWRTDYDERIM
jgi:hypothetical protein